ncbi:MAG: hypothetical protein C4341_04630 [Armatimonadota bacterium]
MYSGKFICREFRLDDDFGWDDGLICGGRVLVLLLPSSDTLVSELRRAHEPPHPDPLPGGEGATGVIEYDLARGNLRFRLRAECCGDEAAMDAMRLRRETLVGARFLEPVVPPERLVIFGAGHVGREVAKLGASLGFRVTVVDDRQDLLTERALPIAHDRVCMAPEAYARQMQTDGDTYLCVVTRGHRNDARVLREVIHSERAYLGMIGSRRKREVIRKEMVGEGICTNEQFDAVQSPMGLDIGAESVEEIAVSIAAELVRVRAAKRGPSRARCPSPKARVIGD